MAEITLRHEINCSEETFWNECVFQDEFNRRLYLEALRFPRYEMIEQSETPDKRTRKVEIDPPVEGLPGPVRKVLGERLRYLEEGVFDKSTRRYHFKITPNALAEKTRTTGELWCEPLGDHRIARVGRIKVEVKLFAIGALLEEKILNDLRASYDAAAVFTNQYVKEKGLETRIT